MSARLRTKAALGDDAFAPAWARGDRMTTEEIVTFAEPDQSGPAAA